jgi:hypothetical protein
MIRSYGLHWRADQVFWGKPGIGNNGSLLGAASRSSKAHVVDFREQRGIYALYAEYELVYVGQTGAGNDRLFKRLKMHRNDHLSERWNRFSWFGTQWVTQKNELSTDTAAVKQTVEAALNIAEHNGSRCNRHFRAEIEFAERTLERRNALLSVSPRHCR